MRRFQDMTIGFNGSLEEYDNYMCIPASPPLDKKKFPGNAGIPCRTSTWSRLMFRNVRINRESRIKSYTSSSRLHACSIKLCKVPTVLYTDSSLQLVWKSAGLYVEWR